MNPLKETGYCPECDTPITLITPVPGQVLTCPSCSAYLEVIDTSPLEFDWADDNDDLDGDDDFSFDDDADDEFED